MKKHFLFSVMVLMTLCVGFSSCSDDDDDVQTEVSIVGNWELVEASYSAPKTMTFNADGTGSNSADGKMTYHVSGNSLTIMATNTIPITVTITKLTATELSYQFTNLTAKYKKVK